MVDLALACIGPPLALSHPLPEHIQPLLRVRDLVEFRLVLTPKSVTAPVLSADLETMARAWPQLQRFDLQCTLPKGCTPVPASSLARMTALCPRLAHVVLPCIGEPLPVGADGAEQRGPAKKRSQLASFEVADGGWSSVISDPAALARFFDESFPRVVLGAPRLASSRWTRTISALADMRKGEASILS